MGSAGQPENYKIGLARSKALRSARSAEHAGKTWAVVLGLAAGVRAAIYDPAMRSVRAVQHVTPPTTLAEFAEVLNELGHRTARGEPWTPQTLHRVFKSYDTTPKKLVKSLLPQPFREPPDFPLRADLFGTLRLLTACENEHGLWMAAVAKPPRPLDWVRLKKDWQDLRLGHILSVRERRRRLVVASDFLGAKHKLRLSDLETWVPKRPVSKEAIQSSVIASTTELEDE